jgi:hypothetical protein
MYFYIKRVHGETRNACRILVGKSKGRRPLGRPKRRWEDNIRMYLREIEWGGVDWIDLAQDRPVKGPCEHGYEFSGCTKCWEIPE